MKESINFNRAATFYDATRKLPEEIASEITQALLGEIRMTPADRVLEIGIGTGRMARPLMRQGVQMVGVDISTEMMGQLLAQLTADHTPPELLLADATELPFRDGSFRAAMVVHVLHLVKSVPRAVREVRRVLAPGGVLLHQTRRPDAETKRAWDDHDRFWVEVCKARGHDLVQRPTQEEIAAALRDSGGQARVIEIAPSEHPSSVETELDNLRERRHSWTWLIPDVIAEEAMGEFEDWLRERADSDGKFADRVTYVIEAWSWS